MSNPPPNQAKAAEEFKAIAEYFLGNPGLNVALQMGGIELGPIALHITGRYFRGIKELETETDPAKRAKIEKKIAMPRLFVEKYIPIIAAAEGDSTAQQLLTGYIATTQNKIIVASGLRPDVNAIMQEAQVPRETTDQQKP